MKKVIFLSGICTVFSAMLPLSAVAQISLITVPSNSDIICHSKSEETGRGETQMQKMLIVGIDNNGRTYIDQQVLSSNHLERALKRFKRWNPGGSIVLHASEDARYSDVVQVLGQMQAISSNRIALTISPSCVETPEYSNLAETPPILLPAPYNTPPRLPSPSFPTVPTVPPQYIVQRSLEKEAEANFKQGFELFQQGTAESSRAAIPYYEKAATLSEQIGNEVLQGGVLLSLATVYMILEEQPKALEYLNQALPLSRAVGDRIQEGMVLRADL